jgi:hypothetical protein
MQGIEMSRIVESRSYLFYSRAIQKKEKKRKKKKTCFIHDKEYHSN